MKSSDIPDKFPIPFANNAGAGFVRPIPEASQITIQAGAASLFDGFPPETFTAVNAGGTPPWGQDFNGLLLQITKWTQWQNAGATVVYDSTFQTNISGYPKGAIVGSATSPGYFWLCLADDNTTNPDTGGAGWAPFNVPSYAVDSGTTNAIVATFSPAPVSLAKLVGVPVFVKISNANTTVNPTIAMNGFAAKTIVNPDGTALYPGQLANAMIAQLVYDGTNVQLISKGAVKLSTRTVLSTGSGTYTTKLGCIRLRIKMCGAGAGGGASGSSATDGSDGTLTSFGTFTANPGLGGKKNGGTSSGAGGLGGTSGTGSALRFTGQSGQDGAGTTNLQFFGFLGGTGGSSQLCGGGGQSTANASGRAATAPGSGGAGAAVFSAAQSAGGGGGAGETAEFFINNPVSSYAYVVGTLGNAGTGSLNGGPGLDGLIIIDEDYE